MELRFFKVPESNVIYESYIISDLHSIPRVGEFCKFGENYFRVKEIMWDLDNKIIEIRVD